MAERACKAIMKYAIYDSNPMKLGESPIWDAEKRILYTVDIEGKSVRITDWETKKQSCKNYSQQIGSIVLTDDGRLMLAMEKGIYIQDEHGSVFLFAEPDKMLGKRFNDGKVGPDGRYYVGTIDDQRKGAFYRVEKNGKMVMLLDGIGCSNGIAWSPDCKTMYYCDSTEKKIEAFSFDYETGSIAGRRTIIDYPLENGTFDGMTIDSDGMLYAAMWQAASLLKVDPYRGEIVERMILPAHKISCAVFAGPGLDSLIVTSAMDSDNEMGKYNGCTFICSCNAKGVAPWKFKLK